MVVDPYFNPNMAGIGGNQGMFGQPRPRKFMGGRGFLGPKRGQYPAQFNQSGNSNSMSSARRERTAVSIRRERWDRE